MRANLAVIPVAINRTSESQPSRRKNLLAVMTLIVSGLTVLAYHTLGFTSHTAVQAICDSIHQLDCYGNDLATVASITTHTACCQACQSHGGCNAWTWDWKVTQNCYLKSACTDQRTDSDAYHSGFNPTPGPSPPAPPATPAPTVSPPPLPPSSDNPLGISPLPRRSDNFFLIIGDYGAPDYASRGCQYKVAKMMKDYVATQKSKGKKCLFVGAVGDNFYATGVQDDNHWAYQWTDVYGTNDPTSSLFEVPWLAVMGNHDYGSSDPGCACGKGCKQFSTDGRRPAGTDRFWMPDYHWNYYIGGSAQLEILGIDTNAQDVGGLGGDGCGNGAKTTCQWCGGQGNMQNFLNGKKAEGEWMLDGRARASPAQTVLIMQHYDGGLGAEYKGRFESQNGNGAHVLTAYGHAHDQQCQGSRTYGCDTILTGGGAGWQGGQYFGFVAVHLMDDGSYQTVMETSDVRFPQSWCSYMNDHVNETATGRDEIQINI